MLVLTASSAYLDAICLGIVGFLFVRWLAVARSSEQRIIKYLMVSGLDLCFIKPCRAR